MTIPAGGGHSLPSISPLPPIEMHDSPSSPPSPRHTPDLDRSSFLQRSTTSLASQNSFTTALSSSPMDQSRTGSPMTHPPLAPPCSLRHSVSVDSFVRKEVPKNSTRPKRTNTDLAMIVPVIRHSRSRDYEHRAFHQVTRSSGVSFNTDYDPSVVEDTELWPLGRRRPSLKGKEQQQPFVPPGELKLPPRMPAPSLASSISSISTAPPSPRQDSRRLQATTSMTFIPGRTTNPALANISGRARSGSLGVKVGGGRLSLINTQMLSKSVSESVDPVTIAVVGALGAGKSTVIHKGAKQFSLSDFTVLSAPPGMLGVQTSLRYVRRIGLVTDIEILGEMTPSCPLHLLEVDIAHLGWEQSTPFSHGDSSAGTPQIDGVLICYDATAQSSFTHVEDLLKRLQILKLPFMVLACKSDLERQVDPKQALDLLQRYDSGLVEASKESEVGKDKMRRSFEWLIMAILRERRRNDEDPDYRNPASPDNLASLPPWENPQKSRSSPESSKVATPAASIRTVAPTQAQLAPPRLQPASTMPIIPSSHSPTISTSPTRARSTSDLLSEHERSKNQSRPFDANGNGRNTITGIGGSVSTDQLPASGAAPAEVIMDESHDSKEPEPKQSRPAQWASLEELLDKLLFLSVSGDDQTFISNFLLTYRRFASPRSVLLAMQKRIRQLDSPSGDPMFACYAQMRICHLLEQWIQSYPTDFVVWGTPSALNALVRTIIAKTYLLHYGCDLVPFAEMLANFRDKDAAWALPVVDHTDESDDSDSLYDDDESSIVNGIDYLTMSQSQRPPAIIVSSRERRPSLPLTAMILGYHEPISEPILADDPEFKKLLKDLVRNSQEIAVIDPTHIAEEITRIEAGYFLEIEPRHWLHYTLVSGRKDPEFSTIARFNKFSNNLADWVVSLILCHDKPKNRARQIEKFVEVAQKLRAMNNYSALRAFVAGINNSTFPGDQTMEIFRAKPDLFKIFQSWDILLQAARSHRAYRMALKSSKGACIPALEVHMSDLIRAHEGNADSNPDYPNKIHWGKFNMMGKFISSTTQCQDQCRNAVEYNFPERPHIRKLMEHPVMTSEMQRSRIAPASDDVYEDTARILPARTYPRDTSSQIKDGPNIVRKLFSW